MLLIVSFSRIESNIIKDKVWSIYLLGVVRFLVKHLSSVTLWLFSFKFSLWNVELAVQTRNFCIILVSLRSRHINGEGGRKEIGRKKAGKRAVGDFFLPSPPPPADLSFFFLFHKPLPPPPPFMRLPPATQTRTRIYGIFGTPHFTAAVWFSFIQFIILSFLYKFDISFLPFFPA